MSRFRRRWVVTTAVLLLLVSGLVVAYVWGYPSSTSPQPTTSAAVEFSAPPLRCNTTVFGAPEAAVQMLNAVRPDCERELGELMAGRGYHAQPVLPVRELKSGVSAEYCPVVAIDLPDTYQPPDAYPRCFPLLYRVPSYQVYAAVQSDPGNAELILGTERRREPQFYISSPRQQVLVYDRDSQRVFVWDALRAEPLFGEYSRADVKVYGVNAESNLKPLGGGGDLGRLVHDGVVGSGLAEQVEAVIGWYLVYLVAVS